MTFGFGFCSVLYGVGSVRLGFLYIFTSGSGSVRFLAKPEVRFFLAGFTFFPISTFKVIQRHQN